MAEDGFSVHPAQPDGQGNDECTAGNSQVVDMSMRKSLAGAARAEPAGEATHDLRIGYQLFVDPERPCLVLVSFHY
jgi:hypothetical protein